MQHTVTEKILKNGITVLYIDIPGSKSLNLAIAFNAGYRFSSRDDIGKYEIPHVLEHLVFDGSERYPHSDDLQGVFSLGGGDSNGFTTPYHNVFAFHNRLRNAKEVLRASLDMVFHPRLEENSFIEEYRVIENEIQDGLGDFAGNAMLYTAQQILPTFPGSGDTQLERLPNVLYEDVVPYHKKYYCTANTTLIVGADFQELKRPAVEKIILEATGKVPRGKSYAFPRFEVAEAHPKSGSFVSVHKSMTDTVACAMFVRRGRVSRKEMLSLGLFGAIATGMKSYSVNYKLRKQGLVYGINLSASESLETYGFGLDITADNRKFSEVYAYTLAAVRDLAEGGITDKQFELARQEFTESFEDGSDSADAIIGWYLQDYLMDKTLLTPADYIELATSITQEEMLVAVRRVFAYENLYHSVFSAKAIRASSSMELLAKEVLKRNKPVTDELLAQNTLSLGGEDAKYNRAMLGLLLSVSAVFIAPLGVGVWQGSLSVAYLEGIGLPWSIAAPIFFILLMVLPFAMHGRELRKTSLQMILAIVAWMAIVAIFKPQLFMGPFVSSDNFIRLQAWSLTGLLVLTLGFALYGARRVIGEWRYIKSGKS